MPSAKIVPFATWGRTSQKAGGNSKWHLLADLRRYKPVRGKPGDIFGPTLCGQALDNPEYGPPVNPTADHFWGVPPGVVVPGTGTLCRPCLRALGRELGSAPV